MRFYCHYRPRWPDHAWSTVLTSFVTHFNTDTFNKVLKTEKKKKNGEGSLEHSTKRNWQVHTGEETSAGYTMVIFEYVKGWKTKQIYSKWLSGSPWRSRLLGSQRPVSIEQDKDLWWPNPFSSGLYGEKKYKPQETMFSWHFWRVYWKE